MFLLCLPLLAAFLAAPFGSFADDNAHGELNLDQIPETEIQADIKSVVAALEKVDHNQLWGIEPLDKLEQPLSDAQKALFRRVWVMEALQVKKPISLKQPDLELFAKALDVLVEIDGAKKSVQFNVQRFEQWAGVQVAKDSPVIETKEEANKLAKQVETKLANMVEKLENAIENEDTKSAEKIDGTKVSEETSSSEEFKNSQFGLVGILQGLQENKEGSEQEDSDEKDFIIFDVESLESPSKMEQLVEESSKSSDEELEKMPEVVEVKEPEKMPEVKEPEKMQETKEPEKMPENVQMPLMPMFQNVAPAEEQGGLLGFLSKLFMLKRRKRQIPMSALEQAFGDGAKISIVGESEANPIDSLVEKIQREEEAKEEKRVEAEIHEEHKSENQPAAPFLPAWLQKFLGRANINTVPETSKKAEEASKLEEEKVEEMKENDATKLAEAATQTQQSQMPEMPSSSNWLQQIKERLFGPAKDVHVIILDGTLPEKEQTANNVSMDKMEAVVPLNEKESPLKNVSGTQTELDVQVESEEAEEAPKNEEGNWLFDWIKKAFVPKEEKEKEEEHNVVVEAIGDARSNEPQMPMESASTTESAPTPIDAMNIILKNGKSNTVENDAKETAMSQKMVTLKKYLMDYMLETVECKSKREQRLAYVWYSELQYWVAKHVQRDFDAAAKGVQQVLANGKKEMDFLKGQWEKTEGKLAELKAQIIGEFRRKK